MNHRLQLKPGKTFTAHVAPIAHLGPNELAHVAPIAHLGHICVHELSSVIAQASKTCAYKLSPTAQALKTCAAELPPIAQAGGNVEWPRYIERGTQGSVLAWRAASLLLGRLPLLY